MPLRKPDIGYLPTPEPVVEAILQLGEITEQDVLYDLGSGDGRILIAAALQWGTRGVGIDIDADRVQVATENACRAGVADRVSFYQQDLFESQFGEATVVMLYLLPHLNLKLRPRLLAQLRSGSRILSLDFDMGDWQPDRVLSLPEAEATVYYWVVP